MTKPTQPGRESGEDGDRQPAVDDAARCPRVDDAARCPRVDGTTALPARGQHHHVARARRHHGAARTEPPQLPWRLRAVSSASRRLRPFAPAIAIGLAAALAAAACAAAPAQLAGKEFVSVAVTDAGAPRPLVPNTVIRLGFSGTNISADAGCNHMRGAFRIEDGRLFVNDLFTTEMGCDPDLMAQDAWLAGLLGSAPTATLAGSDLRLEAGPVVITLRDREVVEPDAQLVGPTWTLESIITGDAVSSVPLGVEATLVFKDDGTVEVNAGCNHGSGTWEAVAGGLEVGPLMLTKMACEKDGATVEGAVLGVLGAGTIEATIDSTVLTLQAGGQGLQYRAA
jgi:heat shock protein HslJ